MATPPTPPAGPTRTSWTLGAEGMNSDFPRGLLQKKIQHCYVEFIDMDARDNLRDDYRNATGERTNHAIITLIFSIPGSAYTPANTLGVAVDLWREPVKVPECSTNPGILEIRTVHSLGHHPCAAYVVEVPVNHGITGKRLGDFLTVLYENDMIPCGFNTEVFEGVVGCRDFTSQFLYRLNEANVLTVTQDIYQNYNYNYGPGFGTRRAGGVGYGAFNATYHAKHHAIAGIRYTGNRLQLEELEDSGSDRMDVDEPEKTGCSTL